jgi:hypothetical protein
MERKNMEIKMRKKINLILLTIPTFLFGAFSFAGTLSVPNSFSSGGTTSAADMNSNFSAVSTAVNDNNTRITALETSSAPVFQGFSSGTVDGGDGIRAMKSACDASFTGSKICTTGEYLNSIYNSSASNLSGSAWLLPEMTGYGSNSAYGMEKWSSIAVSSGNPEREFSCVGWGSDAADRRGISASSSGGVGRTYCNTSQSVACCK